jgi:hypothetical protein
MECVIETKASTILDFLNGLRGSLHVTFEEDTWAAWLYDLIRPRVTELAVCNPRRNALLKEGSKSNRIDARKLAELLRSNLLRSVYHARSAEAGGTGAQLPGHQQRSRTSEGFYRSWGIPCTGKQVMRLRPANIRVINRRENHLDHDSRCLLRERKKKKTVARS